ALIAAGAVFLAVVTAALTPTTAALAEPVAASPRSSRPVAFPKNPMGPKPPQRFGRAIDATPMYQAQNDCSSVALPGTRRLLALLIRTYGRGQGSSAAPRACTESGISEHKDGRAFDWMVNVANKSDRLAAANFLSWLTTKGPDGQAGYMARRLGVMYVIYNRRIWGAYEPGWRPYTYGDPHTSHIHVSLTWNGARAHTSFWTGHTWPTDYGTCAVFFGSPAVVWTSRPRLVECARPVRAPRTEPGPYLWLGSAGTAVTDLQRRLHIRATGSFGRATQRAVLRYQFWHDLPRTGAIDSPTRASLYRAGSTWNAPTWTARAAARFARTNLGSPVLHPHDFGTPALALQTALRMPRGLRTGYIGYPTVAALTAFKVAHDLPATGRVGPAVWALLPVPPPARRARAYLLGP
ncbi:MAG: peptidoglycan-binding domain-containing protein, partial [Solirubrobacteraceae bacterium]